MDELLNRYFDTTGFSRPAPFTFGNLSDRLPELRTDGIRNFDLSLFNEFRPLERLRTQFRAEFLNAFNTPNASVTSTTFGVTSSPANHPRQVPSALRLTVLSYNIHHAEGTDGNERFAGLIRSVRLTSWPCRK